MKSFFVSFIAIFFIFSSLHAWTALLINIHDGDTITVLRNGEKLKIRFYGIDCPELDQAYGVQAGDFLRSLMKLNTLVHITTVDHDRYHRIIGIVEYRGMNINEELIRQGYAWVYDRYYKGDTKVDWYYLQQQARFHRRGLWVSITNGHLPVSPWQFRRNKRKFFEHNNPSSITGVSFVGIFIILVMRLFLKKIHSKTKKK